MGERQAMRRLWWAWVWSRLTRQHRIPWWKIELELRLSVDRERTLAAIQWEIDRHGNISRIGNAFLARKEEP